MKTVTFDRKGAEILNVQDLIMNFRLSLQAVSVNYKSYLMLKNLLSFATLFTKER